MVLVHLSEKIDKSIENLLSKCRSNSHINIKLINIAISFCLDKYNQKSQLEDNYSYINVVHSLDVATILAENTCFDWKVCVGILHSLVINNMVGTQEIKAKFGTRIADIIEKLLVAYSNNEDSSFRASKENTLRYIECNPHNPEIDIICADHSSHLKLLIEWKDVTGNLPLGQCPITYDDMKWYFQRLVGAFRGREGMYSEFKSEVISYFGPIKPSAYINGELNSFDNEFLRNFFLSERNINNMTVIINHYNILDDDVKPDVRDALLKFLHIGNSNLEISEIGEQDKLNIVRLYYLLRTFFWSEKEWICENIDNEFFDFYMINDEE